MTEIRQQAGIRTRIWIGGWFSVRDPLPTVSRRRLEKKTTLDNATVRIDRKVGAIGLPNVLELFQFGLTWADLREPGLLERIDTYQAIGQPFYVGLWKHFYCVYDGDGSTTDFLLPRLPLLSIATPVVPYPDYPTRVTTYDKALTDATATPTELTVVEKTNSNIATGSPSSGEAWIESDGHAVSGAVYCTMRLGTAPANAHDVLRVAYMPAFRVVIDTEDPRAYGVALNEPRGVKLIEVG